MTQTVIRTQSDMDRLFAGVTRQINQVRYRSMLRQQMNALAKQHADWFSLSRSPGGEQWPKLAPSTVRAKGHATILVDTGRLKRSLTVANGGSDGIREIVDEPSGRGIGFGTSVPYSVFHDRASGRRPARRHVGTTELFVHVFAVNAVDTLIGTLQAGQN